MRNLLRGAVGIAALVALAWMVFPGMTAFAIPPEMMLARSVAIIATFLVAWVSLSLAPERPVRHRELMASVTVGVLLLVAVAGLFEYSNYQGRQSVATDKLQERQTKAASAECSKKLAQSKPDSKAPITPTSAPMDSDLNAWLKCG